MAPKAREREVKKKEKEDRESKNGTGKDWMKGRKALLSSQQIKKTSPTRSQFHQEIQRKGWAQIYGFSFSSFSKDSTVLRFFFFSLE